MALPVPVLTQHGAIMVVRDDLLTGGTKMRAMMPIIAEIRAAEVIYSSPAYGYAQIALAHICAALGKRATVFTAKRKAPHKRTLEAKAAGAKVVMVPNGYLSVVQARAQAYAAKVGAVVVPFGVDDPRALRAIADAARAVDYDPPEVWTVSGSGVLTRALQMAWPRAEFHTVQVGKTPNAGRAKVHKAPETFDQDAKVLPPFPSCSNYDAKAWRFILARAKPGALFWNVAR